MAAAAVDSAIVPPPSKKIRGDSKTVNVVVMDENVDRLALKQVSKGEFRVDTTDSLDDAKNRVPQGNAWKPFKAGRGVQVHVWVPEERATGDFLEAMKSIGPGLLTTLKGFAAGLPTAKRRNAFLKKLDKDGFVVTNPSRIKFDSSGTCTGFEEPAYVRLRVEWWMERSSSGRLNSTFRVEDGLGGNVTRELADDAGVAVDTDPVVFNRVAEDGTVVVTNVDGFAPFVRFNESTKSFIHGCITGHQTFQGATVRLSLKDLNLYFGKAIVTDHLGYITVNLKLQPAFVSDVAPGSVMNGSITGVLHVEDDKVPRSGFM